MTHAVPPTMDFLDTLVRFETALWNDLDRGLRESGGPAMGTLWALRCVRRHSGACRVHELRHDLQITVGAASKLADRLERDGLAVRAPNPDDRRSSLIALTERGTRARRAAAEVRDGVLRTAIDPDGEQAALKAIANLQQQLDDYREQVVA